ncbi:class I SAM-dependent methyltransferase [candidate division KSB1 bacterium]|nr:class I SAM-dependent methyltransferase [candidate division KSB1 bacterium]NIR69679.1 class I SAM-dependent methyltransferase [candidate division KSB1 bacterium]NIS24329.1 class I SAM-dependent methyltransferase [candidate division KSB1 bacterium]NIT71257.1 class I SAM-dependent methyltransferase [candidate division KSB1 bacterium]NIU24963.1 class I SAM-dependent methyltransferase [candidate division KSB1 bacterium]
MHSLNNQIRYWDSVAYRKNFSHPLNVRLFQSMVSPEAHILDYGCGYGRTCQQLVELGFKNVIGVDASPSMIERGKHDHPHLNLHLIDDSELPYSNETFDAVLLFSVLTCIPTNLRQFRVVHEISRVLRPNGLLYISDLLLQNDTRNRWRYDEFADEFDIYGIFRLPDGAVVRHHDLEWIESLTSNFLQMALHEIDVTTMNGHPAKAFQYLGRSKGGSQ